MRQLVGGARQVVGGARQVVGGARQVVESRRGNGMSHCTGAVSEQSRL